jgi:regulator of protease activity HflC (stomatin/prohibitin superfamily)
MVSAWFKDAAQELTLIELVGKRAELQAKALGEMRVRFQKYRLNVMEVMIGTPRAMPGDRHIDTVFEQLRVRQVAREQAATYASQQEAALIERELNEALAVADQQTALTASKIAVQVAQNEGEALLQRRSRDAEAIKVTAAADAERTRLLGQAEADRIRAVGEAEASATKAQSDALGGPEVALRKMIAQIMAEAMQHASQPLVPQVVMGGERGASGIVDLLMAMSLANGTIGAALRPADDAPRGEQMR